MRIRATFSHPHPAIGEVTDAHLVVSVHGDTDAGTHRPRVAVIPVVDRSGSMASERKLHLVTSALRHLAEHLADDDRLALVAFDHSVDVPVPLRAANPAGVTAFHHALNGLHPRGSTNLHDALAAAVVTAARTSADTLTRIVVLTDGQANVGPRDLESLTAVMAERPGHVSVSFLGVGMDCDHTLLGRLAEAGGGSYGFIETADDAPSVLGAEVGGLLDAEAHQVQVTVTCRDAYTALAADTPLGFPAERDENTMTFTLAQVLRGVTRNIVIPVKLSGTGRNHARPVTCADVAVSALIDAEPVEFTIRPKVKFTPEGGDPDPDLVDIVDLAKVAAAVGQASSRADAGDYTGARGLLNGLRLSSASAQLIATNMASRYADSGTYNASAADLSSIGAMTRGSLTGGSRQFDSLVSRTVGSYYSSAQVAMAAATTAATGVQLPPFNGDATVTDADTDATDDAAGEQA